MAETQEATGEKDEGPFPLILRISLATPHSKILQDPPPYLLQGNALGIWTPPSLVPISKVSLLTLAKWNAPLNIRSQQKSLTRITIIDTNPSVSCDAKQKM